MNCQKVRSLVSAYVDGELPGLEMLTVRQHLSGCKECTVEYESLLGLKRMFGRLQPKHPATELAPRICRRLREVQLPPYERVLNTLRSRVNLFPMRLRAAVAGLAVFTALLIMRSGGTPPTQSYALLPDYPAQPNVASLHDTFVETDLTLMPGGILPGGPAPVRRVEAGPWLAPASPVYPAHPSHNLDLINFDYRE